VEQRKNAKEFTEKGFDLKDGRGEMLFAQGGKSWKGTQRSRRRVEGGPRKDLLEKLPRVARGGQIK